MFIPTVRTKIKQNDEVILIKDLILEYGTFTKGHIFIVESILDSNHFLVKDLNNNLSIKIHNDYLCKNVSIDEANNIIKYNKNKQKILLTISNFCKMKSNGWDDYEHYYKCQLKKSSYSNDPVCKVKLSCVKYCDENVSKKLLNQIRFLKLNKIQKKLNNYDNTRIN